MNKLLESMKKLFVFGRFSVVFTLFFIGLTMALVLLPENMRMLQLVIGGIALTIFVISWVGTAIYMRQSTAPIRRTAEIVRHCKAKFKGAREKIARCIVVKQAGRMM